MPLLKNPHAIPQDHTRCAEDPCLACAAERYLVPADWSVVEYFRHVSDQVTVLSGAYAEETVWAPRMEGWMAVLQLYQYHPGIWDTLITQARAMYDVMHGRVKPGEAYSEPPQALTPVSWESADG